MRLELECGKLSVEVLGPGTIGVPCDCELRVSVDNGVFSGTVDDWIEGAEMEEFIQSLEELSSSGLGSALLKSESYEKLSMDVVPADRLGHFVVRVKLGVRTFVQSSEFVDAVIVHLPTETAEVMSFAKSLALYLRNELSA